MGDEEPDQISWVIKYQISRIGPEGERLTFIEHLLFARFFVKLFTYIILFNNQHCKISSIILML